MQLPARSGHNGKKVDLVDLVKKQDPDLTFLGDKIDDRNVMNKSPLDKREGSFPHLWSQTESIGSVSLHHFPSFWL